MSIINISEDLQLSEIEFNNEYKKKFKNNIRDAHDFCLNNKNIENKYLNSKPLNDIRDCIVDNQIVYNDNTNKFLNNEFLRFQANVDNLIYLGDFNINKQYYVNNAVLYNDSIWYCIRQPQIGTIDNINWVELKLKGKKGNSALGVRYKGKWKPFSDYEPFDMVYYDNCLYVSTSYTNNVSPINRNYWSKELTNESVKISVVESNDVSNVIDGNLIFEIL